MFGTYRTLLSLMVVALHLGGIKLLGIYAVFGFYILSGYLMTFIMHQNYGYYLSGIIKFTFNRFLRIYPLYWFSCVMSLLLILWLGENYTSNYHEAIYFPHQLESILKNVFILFSVQETPRLTPPAWALTVELFYYIAIALGLSKNKKITCNWFMLGVLYHVLINIRGLGLNYQYFMIPAASLPFATGALIYHYKNRVFLISKYFKNFLSPIPLFSLFFINWLLAINFVFLRDICFYVNCLIHTSIICSLLNKNSLFFISREIDKWIGGFSYPIYLTHYQVGLFMLAIADSLGFTYQRPSISLMLLSIASILFTSWILKKYIENPIENIRRKVKANQKLRRAS